MLWGESSAEFCAQKPAVILHISGIDLFPSLAGREWCAVVWERSGAELRGKKVAKGCVGMKWHRVGWRQSAAQVGGSEVVRSSARTE